MENHAQRLAKLRFRICLAAKTGTPEDAPVQREKGLCLRREVVDWRA
jgi:hypothetical protein